MSGNTGKEESCDEIVRSIKFKTNKRTYGPYGVSEGKPFSVKFPFGHTFVGFVGNTGPHHLNSIGSYDKYIDPDD